MEKRKGTVMQPAGKETEDYLEEETPGVKTVALWEVPP